jgi:hypothetical protein
MALLRRSTLKQFRNFRKEVKRQGGDIGDKISKTENSFPNMVYNRNPFDSDVKVDTYEDDYSIGNNTKLNSKEMKHVRTFESHDIYSTIIKMLDNKQISETEAHQIVDSQKITDVFKKDIKKAITKHCRKTKIESLDESLSETRKKAEQAGAKEYIEKTGEILQYKNGQYLIELDEFVKLHDGKIQYKPIESYKGHQIKLDKNGSYLYSIFKGATNLEDRISSIKKCKEIIDGFKGVNEKANYNFPYGIDQIPQFYLKQWLEKYSLWCEANKQTPKYSNFDEVVGDEDAISTIFYHAELYAQDNSEMLDGSEFVDTSYLKESSDTSANYSYDILRMGKDITVGDIHGKIWKIEGADVYIETKNEDGKIIVKIPISKVAKAYKIKKD